jgi:hypothetical protein
MIILLGALAGSEDARFIKMRAVGDMWEQAL